MTHARHRPARWCCLAHAGALAGCALAVGCAGPALRLDTPEPDASLYVNGRLAGHGAAEVPFRYYGTTAVTALPARHAVREDVRPPVRVLIETPAPAPQWLFPFDFFVEIARRGFRSAPPNDVDVVLPPAESTLLPGTRPPAVSELRSRAKQAQRVR